MNQVVVDELMAGKKGVSVKMDPEIIKAAKMAATGKGLTLYEYLNQVVGPIAIRDAKEGASHLGASEETARKKGGKKS